MRVTQPPTNLVAFVAAVEAQQYCYTWLRVTADFMRLRPACRRVQGDRRLPENVCESISWTAMAHTRHGKLHQEASRGVAFSARASVKTQLLGEAACPCL